MAIVNANFLAAFANKKRIQVKGIKRERERKPKLKLYTLCAPKVSAVFLTCNENTRERRDQITKPWGSSTSGRSPPNQFKPDLSLSREEAKNSLSYNDISLATGFPQSQARTTFTGSNRFSRSPPLVPLV